MDPNANLKELRVLALRLLNSASQPDPADVARFADLVCSLDEWIVNGGFLPAEWQL